MAIKKKMPVKGSTTATKRTGGKSVTSAKKAGVQKSAPLKIKRALLKARTSASTKRAKPATAKKAVSKRGSATASKRSLAPKKKAAPPKRSAPTIRKVEATPKRTRKGNAMPVKSTKHADPIEEGQASVEQQPARGKRASFLQQRTVDPNEQHPGQTAQHGKTHDRLGSQQERVRHLYPNGNRPNSGSARSTQFKGKRRENGPTER